MNKKVKTEIIRRLRKSGMYNHYKNQINKKESWIKENK